MCKASELKRGQNLIQNPLDSVHSSLIQFDKEAKNECLRLTASLKRAILEIIVGRMAFTVDDVIEYVRCTFAHAELSVVDKGPMVDVRPAVESCVDYLIKNEFIQLKTDDEKFFSPTQLGSATLTSSLPPDEALSVFADLQNAQRNFVLDTDLHLLYLVIPYSSRDVGWVDWTLFYESYAGFSKSFRRVADVVGVKESFLAAAARRGTSKVEKTTDQNEIRQICVHKRFFVALALYEVINETSLSKVAQTYGCDRGQLQNLQQQASTYAGMMVQFCDRLGWYHLKLLLSGFAERIAFGVRRELTELVQIDGVDGGRARAFHCSGFSTVASLIQCDRNEIVNVLRKAVPFQSAKDSNKKHPWLAGHSDLTENEAATLILERAKKIFDEKLKRFGVAVDEEKSETSVNIGKSSINVSQKPLKFNSETTNEPNFDLKAKGIEIKILENFKTTGKEKKIAERSNDAIINIVNDKEIEPKQESNSFHQFENEILNDSWFNLSMELKKIEPIVKTDALKIADDNVRLDFEDSSTSIENLMGNLSRFSISPVVVQEKSSRIGTVTESQMFNFLNEDCSSPPSPERDTKENNSTPNLSFNDARSVSMIDQSSTPTLFADEDSEPKIDSIKKKILIEFNSDCLSQDLFTMKRCHASPSNDDLISTPVLRKKRTKNKENLIRNGLQLDSSLGGVIDSCRNDETFEKFSCNLKNVEIISIGVDGTKRRDSDEYENVRSIAFCIDEHVSYVLKLDETNFDVVTRPERLKKFRTIVARSPLTLLVEESKEFLRICYEMFRFPTLKSTVFCIRTAAWMLNQDLAGFNLLSLTKTFFPEKFQNVSSLSKAQIYCVLYPKLLESLKNKNLDQIFYSLELKVIPPTLKMESFGVHFDWKKCDSLIDQLENLMKTIERQCFALAGRNFSISSHRDVSKILYVDLGLPPPTTTNGVSRIANGIKMKRSFSTTRETLQKLAVFYKLPALIVDWRRLNHTLSCYLYPFRKRTKLDDKSTSMGKIYGRYERFTATGRMIMREPSLQTFPKRYELNVAIDETASVSAPIVVNLRSLILPCPGYTFLAADYSQMELRLLAHFSDDRKLKEILNSDDGDVFKMIAAAWMNVSLDDVTPEQRQRAKQICYGIIYGIGPASLAQELNVSEDEAIQFMDSFKSQYKEVSKWISNTIDACRKNGYVTTIAGRRRILEAIRCGTSSEKGQAQRQAVNTTIQGSAADIFKMAFIQIDDEFRRSFAAGGDDYGPITKIVLQMHDELIVEVRNEFLPKIVSIMKKNMERVFALNVKLPVNFKFGPSWGELREFKL